MTDCHVISESNGTRARETESGGDPDLSVVIAVRDPERAAPMHQLYHDYKAELEKTGLRYEFIYVLEGDQPTTREDLRELRESGEPISILVLSRWYGGATVLSAGFKHARGRLILTLPAYHQIDPGAISSLFPHLEDNHMVVVRRWPREDGLLTRLQVRGFHAILRHLLGFNFHDLSCSVIAFKKEILEIVDIYGDQHRFFPVLASHYGYRVKEIAAPQTKQDTFQKHRSIANALNRLFDLLSIFFLTAFTHKPLRFFGFTGLVAFTAGFVLTAYLTVQRLFMGVPLADKPILLVGILLIVLGTLFFAIGLIGEMIIFTHSRDKKEYTVDKVIN